MLIQQEANAAPFDLRSADNDEPPVTVDMLRRVLDMVGHGMLIVSAKGRIVYMNDKARRQICGGTRAATDPLCNVGGWLRGVSGRDEAQLRCALGDATRRGMQRLICIGAAPTTLEVAVAPIGGPGMPGTLAIVALSRAELCDPLSLQLFAKALGLPAAPADVLQQLTLGLDTAAIAIRRGVSVYTVDSQEQDIRRAFDCHKTWEPALRLARLPYLLRHALDETQPQAG
jgi:hypothetical protein